MDAASKLREAEGLSGESRGQSRWYLVRVPEGRERVACERVRRLAGPGAVDEAFVPLKERWRKRNGTWATEAAPAWPGWIVAASRDGRSLARELRRLGLPPREAGSRPARPQPLADEARAWLEAAMDGGRVLRSSTGEIVGGQLRVLSGPLVGQEARVRRIDRHKRRCEVRVGEGEGGFTEPMPLHVPRKS